MSDEGPRATAAMVVTRLQHARGVVLEAIEGYSSAFRDERLKALMLDYPLRPAKALRPALLLATVEALGGSPDMGIPTAAALESLYHNAFLLHDDVEDGSAVRRQQPTMQSLHGAPIAINTGDALLALALTPLLENTALIGLGRTLRVLELFAAMTRVTVLGQAAGLDWIRGGRWDVSPREYVQMVHRKTAWYSFVTPVRAGCIIAGATAKQTRALVLASARLGVAFQIADDLLSVVGNPDEVGKDQLGDLYEGKRTLLLLTALARADAEDRARAISILSRPTLHDVAPGLSAFCQRHGLSEDAAREIAALVGQPEVRTDEDVHFLAALIRRTGADEATRVVARRFAERGRHDLWAALGAAPSEAARFLDAVVTWSFERSR